MAKKTLAKKPPTKPPQKPDLLRAISEELLALRKTVEAVQWEVESHGETLDSHSVQLERLVRALAPVPMPPILPTDPPASEG